MNRPSAKQWTAGFVWERRMSRVSVDSLNENTITNALDPVDHMHIFRGSTLGGLHASNTLRREPNVTFFFATPLGNNFESGANGGH